MSKVEYKIPEPMVRVQMGEDYRRRSWRARLARWRVHSSPEDHLRVFYSVLVKAKRNNPQLPAGSSYAATNKPGR